MIMTIKLAANLSAPLLDLLNKKEIEIDLIKLSIKGMAKEQGVICQEIKKPVLIHYLPDLGERRENWQHFAFDLLNQQVKDWQVPHLSLHLDAYQKVTGVKDRIELMNLLCENYIFIKSQVAVPVLVENVDQEPDWSPNGNYDRHPEIYEINFVNEFFSRTEADFLLDLAHARCLTNFLKIETKKYLETLLLARVKEIHTNGPKIVNDEMCDVHEQMVEEDYQLLRFALGKTQPKVVTLEYGGIGEMYETVAKNDRQSLKNQLQTIKKIISNY